MSTGFMAASGSTPRGGRLQRLRAPDLGAADRDRRVVGHVLRLERRDPDAGAGQPPADAGRHDALAGVGRRPAHEQRAPHRADTLLAPIVLPPARVEAAHLDPAAARRHRAPAPAAAGVEEEPAARGPRAAVHAGQARRVGEQGHGVDRDGEADRARLRRGPVQAPGAGVGGDEPRGARRLGMDAGERLEVGPPRAATPARVPRRRGAGRAAARVRPRARRRRRTGGRAPTTPSRRPQRARSRGTSRASVLGVRGSPADDQSTLLAKSRHSSPPQSLIVSGADTRTRILTCNSRKSVR